MGSFRVSLREFKTLSFLLAGAPLFLMAAGFCLPRALAQEPAKAETSAPARTQDAQSINPQSKEPQVQEPKTPAAKYDPAIFEKRVPNDQLEFLNHFAGRKSKDAVRDKEFRKLMSSFLPDCVFHYGWDMPLADAMEKVLEGSSLPVQIRDGRYFMVSGSSGPYLQGRGFLWIDMKAGIGLGGFYFHPTNGEPTPTVTIFSRQVKEESLGMSQLPPAFAEALSQWAEESNIAAVTTRYFITGANKKILLEHDEDYCAPADGTSAPPVEVCEQMNADAADIDMDAAYYLDQTNHATNATAWMIVGPEQVAWIQVRDNTCRVGPERLRCRIRLTRERTHVIITRHSVAQLPRK
jgi:uncharacterized protein YecT (DUF1311 family)